MFLRKTIKALEDENQAIDEELSWYTTRRNETIERSNWEKVEALLGQFMGMEARVKEEARIISEVEKKLASTSIIATKLKNKIEIGSSRNGGNSMVASLPANNNIIFGATAAAGGTSKLEQLPPEQFDWKEYMTKRKLETVSETFKLSFGEKRAIDTKKPKKN